MKATRRLASFLGPYKLWVVLAPLLMALEVGMDLLQPLFIQRIIDDGVARSDFGLVWRTGGWMLLVAFIGMLGGVLCTFFAILAAQGFGADLRGALFGKAQTLPCGTLDRLETGGLIPRLTNDVTQLIDAVAMMLRIMVRAPLLLVGSLALATLTSPRLALLFFVLLPLIAGTNTSLKNANLAAIRTMVVIFPAMLLILNLGVVAALWFGGLQIDRGNLQVGELIAFINYLIQTLFGLLMTSIVVVRFSRAEASAERVNEVLISTPEIPPPADPVMSLSGHGEVVFDDVTFRYAGLASDSEPVLQD